LKTNRKDDSPQIPIECPSSEMELKTNGLSLVFYNFYILTDIPSAKLPNGFLERLESPNHYQVLFEFSNEELPNHIVYLCKRSLAIRKFSLPSGNNVNGSARLYFQLLNGRFLLATTVVNVDQRAGIIPRSQLKTQRSLSVDDILAIIMQIAWEEGSVFNELERQREAAIESCFGEFRIPRISSQSRKMIGIQIWDIENLELKPDQSISGSELAYRYAWEITALLQCTSDLMRVHHAWRRRSCEQVEQLLGRSTAVLADHRIVTNGRVCLEISQVTHPSLTERSSDRLRIFGYDSTSIYLWGYLAFSSFVIDYFSQLLSGFLQEAKNVMELPRESTSLLAEYKEVRDVLMHIVDAKIDIYKTLDSVFWITGNLLEKRHVNFFQNQIESWQLDSSVERVEKKLRELTSIASDVHQVLTNMEERNSMDRIRELAEKAEKTNRGLEALNIIVALFSSVVLSQFIGTLNESLNTPTAQTAITVAIFVFVVSMYLLLVRSKRTKRPKAVK